MSTTEKGSCQPMVQILTKEYGEHSATLYRLVAIQPNIVTSHSQTMMQLTKKIPISGRITSISTSWSRGASAAASKGTLDGCPTRKKKNGLRNIRSLFKMKRLITQLKHILQHSQNHINNSVMLTCSTSLHEDTAHILQESWCYDQCCQNWPHVWCTHDEQTTA